MYVVEDFRGSYFSRHTSQFLLHHRSSCVACGTGIVLVTSSFKPTFSNGTHHAHGYNISCLCPIYKSYSALNTIIVKHLFIPFTAQACRNMPVILILQMPNTVPAHATPQHHLAILAAAKVTFNAASSLCATPMILVGLPHANPHRAG